MRDSGFLIVNKNGIVGFKKGRDGPSYAKTYKTPALAPGERAVFLTLEVPDSSFSPRPNPAATIIIPEEKLAFPAIDVVVETPPTDDGGGL